MDRMSFIDLTHTLSSGVPHWSRGCGFNQKNTLDYEDCGSETKFRVQSIEMFAGIGTHIDAPAHCVAGGSDIASIPLSQLISPCTVIDISDKADEKYVVTEKDIRDFELLHGVIEKQSLVIIHTGWSKFWNNPEKYHNNFVFPTISLNAVELLMKREIIGLDIDTLSPDREEDGFPVHRLMLGSGRYIIENIAHANCIPPTGAFAIALPLKIQDGTESPIRLIAAIKEKK
jgi:kynurenine formamidase